MKMILNGRTTKFVNLFSLKLDYALTEIQSSRGIDPKAYVLNSIPKS